MNALALRRFLFCLLVLLIGVGLGWQAHHFFAYDWAGRHKIRLVKGKQSFKYTNPLLDVELPEGLDIRSMSIPFKYKIEELIEKEVAVGAVKTVSVYFRDLGEGPWFGINQDLEFNAASLMKIAVMIAWLKRAESDPGQLRKTFLYDGREDLSVRQVFRPGKTVIAGQRYTVDELLRYMMVFSDNNSTTLLFNALDAKELNDIIAAMDVNYSPTDSSNYISSHGYSGFFRILYNSSYLNRKMSEKALQLLAEPDFKLGIVAGVPVGVTVASKFGEMEYGVGNAGKQLHEFGIVYHPRGPYILGVMTAGSSFELQAEIIRNVSAMIYNEVEKTASLDKKANDRK